MEDEDTTHRYRLKGDTVAVRANDLVLERGDTVELDEETAQAINDRRDEPVIERAGGSGDDGDN